MFSMYQYNDYCMDSILLLLSLLLLSVHAFNYAVYTVYSLHASKTYKPT